jgi:tRNA-dihydrouridine synthase
MLRNIPLMLEITREVVKAVNTPVTVKTRLGWDDNNLIITELAEQLQDCGIKALTIHGRTRAQMYTGDADWTLIGKVKQNPRINIPIIGNGDITSPEEAKRAFDEYGVDAVMVGRATFGRPWIFKEMRDYIDGKPADYFRANYILRAMVIPAGEHTVEFKCEAPKLYKLIKVNLISGILFVLLVAGSLVLYYRKPKKETVNQQ